jgi:hypothetical protein
MSNDLPEPTFPQKESTLEDSQEFIDYATKLIPWLNWAMNRVSEGVGQSPAQAKINQEVYSKIRARTAEVFSEVYFYYVQALATAEESILTSDTPAYKKAAQSTTLTQDLAKSKIKYPLKLLERVKQLMATLELHHYALCNKINSEGPPPREIQLDEAQVRTIEKRIVASVIDVLQNGTDG